MPELVNGIWVKAAVAASEIKEGAFHREPTRFRDWITPTGAAGPDGQAGLPALAGRTGVEIPLCFLAKFKPYSKDGDAPNDRW